MQKNKRNKPTFTVIGLGFISDRHLQAIKDIGGKILIGCDIDESKKHKIGDAKFYTDWKQMLNDEDYNKIDYISICTPNNLHFPMVKTNVLRGKKVIIEKPFCLKIHEIYDLKEHTNLINCIVQLRYNPELISLKKKIDGRKKYEAEFAVHVHRDDWYFNSWKNDVKQSGGLLFNIGIHYFDLLCWMFGIPIDFEVLNQNEKSATGTVKFNNCQAKWSLSIDQPIDNQFRYFKINGKEYNLSDHFEGLHTKSYQEILKGKGIKIKDTEEAIKLVSKLTL